MVIDLRALLLLTDGVLLDGAATIERSQVLVRSARDVTWRARAIVRGLRCIRGGSAGERAAEPAVTGPARPTPSSVTQYGQVQALLREHPHTWFCSGCLGASLGLRAGVVMMLALRLEGHAEFRRSYQDCVQCGRFRLVSAFVGLADKRNADVRPLR